jgi:ubiquinone biosynthesis protein UbiJ
VSSAPSIDGDEAVETPGLRLPDGLLATLQAAINRLLALDPEGAARLAPLQGRLLRVELQGFGFCIDVVPIGDRLLLYGHYDAAPDCIVRGTPAALLAMALAEHREDQVFGGSIRIEGDNRLAQDLGEVFKGLDIDWEEQFAKLVGDAAAHRAGRQVRAAARWTTRNHEVLRQDLRDYLVEEGRLLPSPTQMQAFLDGVDDLRDDVERLEARLRRLVDRLGPEPGRLGGDSGDAAAAADR